MKFFPDNYFPILSERETERAIKLVKDIFGLTGTWATDPNYGNKIDEILSRMEKINDIGLK